MQNHLDNECTNKRKQTNTLPLTNHSKPATKPQATTNLEHHETQHQPVSVPQQWNEETIAAIMVIKRAILKEENERCRAEAECRLEIKKLNQRIQAFQESVGSSKLTQVSVAQFHELREEMLLLKDCLAHERQERHRIEQQLAYEVEKSNVWFQHVDDLKLEAQKYRTEIETQKLEHEEEVSSLLQELVEERQQRLRAETELKMEAAKLEDLCCTLEQWRDEEKSERYHLGEQHRERELGWKRQVEEKNGEVEKLKNVVEKYNNDVDEFRKFLSSENVMISGLWAEQLAEVRNLTARIESINQVSEAKSKETAQMKQCIKECDESITRQARGNAFLALGHIVWRISDFEAKMNDAKENDTVLHSPVFYSSEYGYKLRVELRLNGMGQWTGRHMTASLQVLEGEWDPLLQWPFNQRVTLTLRDQNSPPDKVNSLVKNLVEGKEKEVPAGLHVFIPHTTLQQHNYVCNNIMYIEVTVG
jgi:hypothetical protein